MWTTQSINLSCTFIARHHTKPIVHSNPTGQRQTKTLLMTGSRFPPRRFAWKTKAGYWRHCCNETLIRQDRFHRSVLPSLIFYHQHQSASQLTTWRSRPVDRWSIVVVMITCRRWMRLGMWYKSDFGMGRSHWHAITASVPLDQSDRWLIRLRAGLAFGCCWFFDLSC